MECDKCKRETEISNYIRLECEYHEFVKKDTESKYLRSHYLWSKKKRGNSRNGSTYNNFDVEFK